MSTKAAKRYGVALYALGEEQGQTMEIANQLKSLAELWRQSPELSGFLLNPGIKKAQKAMVLQTIGDKMALLPSLTNLLGLLLDKGRLAILPDLAREFANLADTTAGRVRAQCYTAKPLSAEELAVLRQRLLVFSGAKDISLSSEVDQSLLAGFVADISGTVIDASLKGRLNRLRQSLAR